MGDQPGAGGSRSYKIRGYTRERQSAKPYARPPGRRKGVIETVKDFFSPSWLVDLFKGNQRSLAVTNEDANVEVENDNVSQTVEESSSSTSNERSSNMPCDVSASKVGNGQLRSSLGPGYFSSILRQREEVLSDFPSTSRPSRTFGLSSGFDRLGEPSTSLARSVDFDREVPSSKGEDVHLDTVAEDDEIAGDIDMQERAKPEGIMTSTPALLSSAGCKKRANTSIFGEPVSTSGASMLRTTTTSRPQLFTSLSDSRFEWKANTSVFGESSAAIETSTSRTVNTSRPQLFVSSNESHPGPQPFSFAKNRPSFSVSTFGSPFPPKAPQAPQAGGFNSPFYRGKTTFGGASSLHSVGHKRLRTSSPTVGEPAQPARKVITPKPLSSAGSGGVTSQTAKRILEALENMSSPLIDARKIPTPPISPSASPLSFSPAQRKRPPVPSRAVGTPRTLKARFPGPPVQDLSAPQQASISQLKPKDTSSPETAAMSSSSIFSTATTTVPTYSKPSLSSFTPTPLPISLSPSSSDIKVGGKVKSARNRAHYSQRERSEDGGENEVVNPIPEVKAAVPLPLPNGKSLPSFSFASPSESTMTNSPSNEMSPMVTSTAKVDLTKNNFKFSKPAEKVNVCSQESSKAINQLGSNKITFSFSQPVSKSSASSDSKNFVHKQGNNFAGEMKQTEKQVELNNNLLKKFAPLPGSWTCDTCLVSNKSTDTKCVACQASKPLTGNPAPKRLDPTSNDLKQKSAPPADSWTACETAKPGSKPPMLSSKPLVNLDNNLKKKFAPSKDEWSCDTCLVQNKSTDSSCVACESPKPGAENAAKTSTVTFGLRDNSVAAKFAPPSGSWTCDKKEESTCAACETPKSGSKPAGTISSGGFSFAGGQSFSSSPFTFGVKNISDANVASPSSVKFDIESQNTEISKKVAITFGSNAEDQSKKLDGNQHSSKKLPASFMFGAAATQTDVKGEGEKPIVSMQFTFGNSTTVNKTGKGDDTKAPTFSFGDKSSGGKDKASTAGVTFGTLQVSTSSVVDKANSIVAAAAGGLLKVPEIKKPAITSTTEQGAVQTGAGMTIADAAKSGFLAVPTAGEKKENDNLPPNVNLFASTSASTAKKETGVSFAAPSTAPLPFQFGAATTASPATAGAFGQGASEGASSNPAFQFGAVTSSASGSLSQPTSTVTPAPSPFRLATNAVSTVKTTATTPFNFVANAGAPVTTPAPTFAFGSNTATAVAVSTGTVGTFQFSASGTVAKPTAQVDSLAVFNFGPSNTTPATSAATQTGKLTFGIPAEPATSSSNTVKPFGFNVGSAAQGFSFAASKPNEATTEQPATFSFGLSAAKPDTGFPTFGVSQSTSSNQQASATSFMFGPSSSSAPAGSEETMEADGGNSSTNLFGSSANAAPPAFGSVAPAAGFNFGIPNAPGTGGFNFGGAQTNTGPSTFAFAPSAGGAPGFGATNAPAASASTPGGFNFTPVDNGAAAPAMFNFTGGAPQSQQNVMFTTGVGSDLSNPGMAQRRFKKAVRRTTKR